MIFGVIFTGCHVEPFHECEGERKGELLEVATHLIYLR